MSDKIRLIRTEPQYVTEADPNKFEFNPDGRMRWLQKLLFKILRSLKADSFNQRVTYKTTEIDTEDILTALMKNRVDVERLYNKRARYVVMGTEDFMRLSRGAEIHDLMRLNFQTVIGMSTGGVPRRTVLGMEVVIVPWIEGFFVLPDLEQEQVISQSA